MDYINPNYLELITPLTKWKILSLDRLLKLSTFKPSRDNLYKIINNLEKKKIIESFIDPLSKFKHIYLTDAGASFMGLDHKQNIKRDSRYHDALMSQILGKFQEEFRISAPRLDFEIAQDLSSYDHIPDAEVISKDDNLKEIKVAFELEINQKNKTRIQNTFQYYMNSSHFDQVTFIFLRPTPFKTYAEVLSTYSKEEQEQVILLFEPRLSLQYATLTKAKVHSIVQKENINDYFFIQPPPDWDIPLKDGHRYYNRGLEWPE